MTRPSIRRGVLGAVAVGFVVTASLVVSPRETAAAASAVSADPLAFGLLVAGCYLVRPLFAWPTTPLSALVGYGFGVVLGVPIALAGVLVTVTPPYLVMRWLGGGVDGSVSGRFGPESVSGSERAKRVGVVGSDGGSTENDASDAVVTDDESAASANGIVGRLLDRADALAAGYFGATGPVRGVVAARLLPIPSDVATVGAATAGVSLRQLLVGTVIGELPWTVAAVVVGASAASVAATGVGAVGWPVLLACVLAGAVLLAGPVYRVATDRGDRSAVVGSRSARESVTDPESETDADVR